MAKQNNQHTGQCHNPLVLFITRVFIIRTGKMNTAFTFRTVTYNVMTECAISDAQ